MKFLSSLNLWRKAGMRYALAHKFISGAALAVLVGLSWWGISAATQTTAQTKYVLGTASVGTIISSISGSGQVSASRQVDLKPQVTGTVTYVGVVAGQQVKKGALIAQIDASDALKALRNAQNSLETAQLNLEKLQEPASGLTLLQAQNAVASAQDASAKTYVSSESDVVNVFLSMPDIMARLQDEVIGTTASRGSQWNIDYYQNAIANYDSNAYSYRSDAYDTFVAAQTAYNQAFADYKAMSSSPDNATIEQMTQETNDMVKKVSDALKSMNAFVQLYNTTLTNRSQTTSSVANAALTSLAGDITTANNFLSDLVSDTTAISGNKQSLAEKQQSLSDLIAGPDALDVRSDQLSIQQQQDAVTDAQVALAQYSIRAPFDGIIASVDAYVGDTADSTAIASIITPQQVVELSLNEVDAAKVKEGDKATLTFDAIDTLSLTGTVAAVDPVGTVTQGVVSYGVQITLDTQSDQVKPGMTVNAAIQTDVHQNVLTVPSSAVKTSNGQSYVQVFTPALANTGGAQGVASDVAPRQVPVTVGISDDTNVEILSGLTEGEQIVVRTSTAAAASKTPAAAAQGGATRGGNAGFGGGGIRL